jgi:hypothetical protein
VFSGEDKTSELKSVSKHPQCCDPDTTIPHPTAFQHCDTTITKVNTHGFCHLWYVDCHTLYLLSRDKPVDCHTLYLLSRDKPVMKFYCWFLCVTMGCYTDVTMINTI